MSASNPELEAKEKQPKPSGRSLQGRLRNLRDLPHGLHEWWNTPLEKTASYPDIPEADREKLQSMLEEQAQQARTMFFTYLSVYSFLLITLFSVTDKAILLNNTLIKLPLIGSDIPLNILFLVAPPLLIVTYNNFQIHYHRYVRMAFHPSIDYTKRLTMFPFALFQGMFLPAPDGVGFLESIFTKSATFCLLTPALFLYLVYGGKFQNKFLDYFLLTCLMLGLIFERFWLQETFLAFLKMEKYAWTRGLMILKVIGLTVMMWGLWHLIPYTISAEPLRAFPAIDDLDWVLLGLALLLWQEWEKIDKLYGHTFKHKQTLQWLITLLVVLGTGALLIHDFQIWIPDQKLKDNHDPAFTQKKSEWHELQTKWNTLTNWQTYKQNRHHIPQIICKTVKPILSNVFKALYEQRFHKEINFINWFLFLNLNNQVLSIKPPGLDDIRNSLVSRDTKEPQLKTSADNSKKDKQENKEPVLNWIPWLSLPNKSLNRVNFMQSSLPWADFYHAQLIEANLDQAELQYSHFKGANLENANLVEANLENTNLVGANLEGAKLVRANLENADLVGANLENALLPEANLRGVYFVVKGWNEKTRKWIPDYEQGGEELCAAQTLEGAKVDELLWNRLKDRCPDKALYMDIYPNAF